MGRHRQVGGPNVWPVVAEFFLVILAVLVLVQSRAERVDPELPRELSRIQQGIANLPSTMIKEAVIAHPESRIVFSDEFLGFADCDWRLTREKISEVQRVLNLFLPIAPYVSAMAIEGHADTRTPSGCRSLTFGTNFELSQRRALSVYAGLLHVPIHHVEMDAEVDSMNQGLESVVWRLWQRRRVLVAGYGATQPWPGVSDPVHNAHRRVEIRFTLCRRLDEPLCASKRDTAAPPSATTPPGR